MVDGFTDLWFWLVLEIGPLGPVEGDGASGLRIERTYCTSIPCELSYNHSLIIRDNPTKTILKLKTQFAVALQPDFKHVRVVIC